MADVYSVLMNSLRKRDIADPAARERVYLRARMALIRKLWAQRPRMTDREIEDEMAVFDLAVGLVESDIGAALQAKTRPRRQRPGPTRAAVERQIPEIRFHLTERDVDAEADPRESDQLAYRTHLKEAAARVNQWTEAMVRRIDPASVGAVAFAGGGGVHRAALTGPVLDIAAERAVPSAQRRGLGGLFARKEDPQAPPTSPDPAGAEPSRVEEAARRVVHFFEQLSDRLHRASVLAERERKGKLTPRVPIRPPPRFTDPDYLRRRRRRQLLARVATPLGLLIAVAAAVWAAGTFYPTIADRVADFAPPASPPTAETALSGSKPDDPAEAVPQADIVLFDGRDPAMVQSDGGSKVAFQTDAGGGHVRIAASGQASGGAQVAIGPPIANRLARRSVRVVITVRSSATAGAGTVRFGYRAGSEASPLSAQPLGKEYRRLELAWTVPGGAELGAHAIVIEPGLPGGGAIDVKAAEIFLEPDGKR